ncbi:MAG: hypothetical protein SVU94_10750 [Bacteroidota bacterium]|nr:hypothetical protein [Bacteroidota bacterium]
MEKWTININVFEKKELNNQVAFVINDIVKEFDRLISTGPPMGYKPIKLINDLEAGPTFYWPLGKDFYKIGINVSGVYYNQIAFQFSQELCRIYCDPRINSWMIELLCHIAALYALDFLAHKWEESPPNKELEDYWYNFDSYKSNLLGAAFSKVDMVKYQVANEWVEYQINKLRKNDHLNRGKLLIIAYELLPLFKEHPESWLMLPYVGKSSVPPPPEDPKSLATNRNTEPDFGKLIKMFPKELSIFAEKFFTKIGAKGYL